jgi:hypothetical protein
VNLPGAFIWSGQIQKGLEIMALSSPQAIKKGLIGEIAQLLLFKIFLLLPYNNCARRYIVMFAYVLTI